MNEEIFTREDYEEALKEDEKGRSVSYFLLSMIAVSAAAILLLVSCA